MEKDISFYPPKFESEKIFCQTHFSDCVFQLRIILPNAPDFRRYLKNAIPPIEMKCSQVG